MFFSIDQVVINDVFFHLQTNLKIQFVSSMFVLLQILVNNCIDYINNFHLELVAKFIK